MSRKTVIIILVSILSIYSLNADNSEAKELFDEADCMSCHNNEDFIKRKDKVNSLKRLHKAVKACEFGNEAGWFDDETLNVSKYLNKKYYKFKKEAAK